MNSGFWRILLVLVAGAITFAATRALRVGIQPERTARERNVAASLVQPFAEEHGSAEARAWVYLEEGDLGLTAPAAGEAVVKRQLERGIEAFEPEPVRHHLQGLLALRQAWKHPDPTGSALGVAEAELAAALEAEPQRASAWNDLSAVYLTWAAQQDRPRLSLDAYSAAHAALAIDPDLAEARFNRALALESLGLFKEAAVALHGSWPHWVDRNTIFAKQAEMVATDPVALQTTYFVELDRSAESGDLVDFIHLVDRFPRSAQRWAEEILLPRWAEGYEVGDFAKANRWLTPARALGKRLAPKEAGDPVPADFILNDAVAAIDDASARGDRHRLALLAAGHRAFGRGSTAFPGDLATAAKEFQDAESRLVAGASPFAVWATFYRGACLHLDRAVPAAMAVFDGLTGTSERYPSLTVRLGWGRGLLLNQLGISRAALNEYAATRHLASALGDGESVAAIGYQEAEVAAVLAEHEDAWRSLAAALREGALRDRYRVNILFTAANQIDRRRAAKLPPAVEETLKIGLADLQQIFQKEAIRVAIDSGIAAFVAQNRIRWASRLEAQGRWREAANQRRLAAEVIATIEDSTIRERLLAELALGSAAAGFVEVPAADLEAALETFRRQNLPFRAINALLGLADRDKGRGDRQDAERRLAEAQRMIEVIAAGFDAVQDRHGYLVAAGRVFRARIEMALEEENGASRALELFLREQKLRRHAEHDPAASADPWQSSPLPSDTAFVAFLELPGGRLAALVLTSQGAVTRDLEFNASRLKIAVTELQSRIDTLREMRFSGSAKAVDTSLGELSRHLIAPIEELLPEAGDLGLALDDSFAGIPFEALSEAPGKRRMVERFSIARMATPEPLRRAALTLARPGQNGLVMGADQPAPSWRLDPLRGAAREIEAIVEVLGLPADRMLAGPSCTRRQILRDLPRARWIHFAGHAIEDPADPASSLLILAEDGAEREALTIGDLAKAANGKLEMAILSGCETARAGTGGMVQALERAGVPVAIGSLWEVDDQATAKFFKVYYKFLAAGVPPIQALHETRLEALRSKDPQLASVATWAAFAGWGR